MSIADIRKQATDKMAKSVETLKHDLAKVRTGRAHTGLIDHLRVDYYGSDVPINQVASITLSDARTISIQPFEKKMIQVVEDARVGAAGADLLEVVPEGLDRLRHLVRALLPDVSNCHLSSVDKNDTPS